MVEGVYDRGSRCVVLEDVVTSGSSVLETVSSLQDVGVVVKHVVAIVDREQGAELTLTNAGLIFHRYNYNFSWVRDYLRVTKFSAPTSYTLHHLHSYSHDTTTVGL